MIPLTIDNLLLWVAVIVVAVFGVGRLARLITYDDYPPTIAIRTRWAAITRDGLWAKLATCFWCLTPWLMLGAGAWFALGLVIAWVAVAWWLFWGWLGISYVTSMVVARDEPPA